MSVDILVLEQRENGPVVIHQMTVEQLGVGAAVQELIGRYEVAHRDNRWIEVANEVGDDA